jgi:long-chain acyl-CoA synthetase
MDADTLPKLMLRNAERLGRRDAMRENQYGIWQTYSWLDYAANVRRFALGLAALGFRRGDRLAVIGENRPRLYWAMLAAQALGGVSLALYQDSIQKEMGYVIGHADARFIVAEDVEQVDKMLEVRGDIPTVEKVIFDDPKGLEVQRDPWLIHYPQVQTLGDAFGRERPGYFDAEVAQGTAADVALLSYTSGTTGAPKGARITHANLLSSAQAVVSEEDWRPSDEVLARLPMAWIGDFTFCISYSLMAGVCISCPESPQTVSRDYRDLGPTLVLAPPRNWEATLTQIQVRMQEADWIKRGLYDRFMGVALRVERLRQEHKPVPARLRALNALGDLLVRAPLRDLLGLTRVRRAYTGGAPLGPDVFSFFRALGVNLKQLYGLTETTAGCIFQPEGEASAETVGRPLPGVEVRIADNGEIFLRGPMVFKGYSKNDEATRSALSPDGWLATGDAGFLDHSGHLKVIDRAKDVSRLRDGTLFAPQYLENKLKYSPFIREAVTVGVERPFVAALINFDLESLENWAERRGLAYTGYQDLSQKPETYQLIHDEIVRINKSLALDKELAGAQIRRFLILNKELDADDGEITRTRKLRRNVIAERYGGLIEALYSDAAAVDSEVQVTYEDGRTAVIRGRLAIREVLPESAAKPAAHKQSA